MGETGRAEKRTRKGQKQWLTTTRKQASHPATNTITHHGFSEQQIRGIFEGAGVGKDFALEEMAVVFHFSKESGEVKRKLFMARGTKA